MVFNVAAHGFRLAVGTTGLGLLFLLGGCGGAGSGTDADADSAANRALASVRQTPYQFANQCYQLNTSAGFVAVDPASATYTLVSDQAQAASFYMKPTGLGTYLFYDQQEYLLGAHETPVRTRLRDMRLEWQLEQLSDTSFALQSTDKRQFLASNGAGLYLSDQSGEALAVSFALAEGCAEYPEIALNATGEPAVTEFEDGAVWGMADAHAHLFGTLAFAGNVMAGDVFHPLGVQKALHNCRVDHGLGGKTDITGFVTQEGDDNVGKQVARLPYLLLLNKALHDTRGYPGFSEWPNNKTTTHQISYYRWLERAYLGGLRLMVNLLVESGPLCKVGRDLSESYAPIDDEYEYDDSIVCNGEATSARQLQATYDLVDYIDAQHGGPGKGWLQLVSTPEEARAAIKNKKLAMILGSETPDLFGCIDGVEGGRSVCTKEYIEQRLDEYDRRGIKSIFPVHHYDNDFGGARVFNPIIEVASLVQNGNLFKYDTCEAGYNPILAIQLPRIYYLLFPSFIRDLPLFPFAPEGDSHCNRKGLTELGAHLIREMMKRGMLIETAHMSRPMKEAVVEMAKYYDYPLVDSHWGKAFDDSLKQEEERYLKLGGVRAPLFNRRVSVPEYNGVPKNCEPYTSQDMAIQLMAFSDLRQTLGMEPGVVFGTDMHGMVQPAYPRCGEGANCQSEQQNPVTYPFRSFDGGVEFQRQVSGNRTFDINTDGLAHIGLLPDVIQDMRNQGVSDEYVTRFFRGAESYLQMWEKARERGSNIE